MPQPDRVAIAHDSAVTVNIVVRSDRTGLLYKLWKRQAPSEAWQEVGNGISDDLTADRFDLGVMGPGSALAYWFGVGGPSGDRFHVDVAFLQHGAILAGGVCAETGQLDDSELAIVESRVAFP